MKRRQFITTAVTASLAAGTVTSFAQKRVKTKEIKPKVHDFSEDFLKVTKPKPQGTMEIRELGTTGIKVSRYTFGSHTPKELMGFPDYRKNMLMEAYDLGVNTYDVYEPQYVTSGEYLRPLGHNVLISIHGGSVKKLSATKEHERILRLFKRDYIDMVRLYAHTKDSPKWGEWDAMFKMKEKGQIRAVGTPIHFPEELTVIMEEEIPIDFVVFPYNFYHNILYTGKVPNSFDPIVAKLRQKGIGIVTMKPFASEWYVAHLMESAREIDPASELSLGQAMLRYILNSGLEPDTTMGGMWCQNDVYDNIAAFYNPAISAEEEKLLDDVREYAKLVEDAVLPDHYRFLNRWSPKVTKLT